MFVHLINILKITRSRTHAPLLERRMCVGIASHAHTSSMTTIRDLQNSTISTSVARMSSPTQGFKFNHTMIRIKDPKVSLKWYQEVLGMTLISEAPQSDFTLYFLGYETPETAGLSAEEKSKKKFAREALLELTHNHGTESDPDFKGYSSGNTEPGRGFGHLGISVPDIVKACERFDELGVTYKKRLTDGKMKSIAFILDPDGYWIEIVPAGGL